LLKPTPWIQNITAANMHGDMILISNIMSNINESTFVFLQEGISHVPSNTFGEKEVWSSIDFNVIAKL
jgi:hypothetical protein